MADDATEDNIVRLEQAREKRRSQLNELVELDEAKLKELRAESQRALEELVVRFNAQYAIVNESGKIWVFRWRRDPAMRREVLERIRIPDFLHMFENQHLAVLTEDPKTKAGGQTVKTLAEWWLKHPARRQFLGGVTFDPLGQPPADYWNLWRGFAVEPRHGNWSLMHAHIENVLCSGIREHSDYVLNWMARALQRRNEPGEVAVVFRGPKGCGKGIFGRCFVAAFGQHGIQIFNPTQLVGRFNEHLRDCIALFGDEAFYAGDKQHEGVLKGLITEPFLTIEGKGLRVIVVPNMLHVVLASNSDWVIPASSDERRYAVFDVPDSRVGNLPYFAAIDRQIRQGGLAAMLHDLLARDISGFEVRAVPQTEALTTQKLLSLDSLDRWWLAVLERGFVWRSRHGVDEFAGWREFYSTELLARSYLQWCGDTRVSHPASREALGVRMRAIYSPTRPRGDQVISELETWPPGKPQADLVVKSDRPPGYSVGTLDEARDRFSAVRGVAGDWSAAG
jgi:Family of unknown function (DUF5906)